MLSDEEKAVLKTAKENYGLTSVEQKILVNLIKKQSKEIEELKKYEEGYKLLNYSLDNYTSNDKIKAKIEKLDEEIKAKREIAKNPMDRVAGKLLIDSIVELEKTKKVLKSLLEKE